MTCTTHMVQIVGWALGPPDPQISPGFDFQCGGLNSNYRIQFNLQQEIGGSWSVAACGTPGDIANCVVYRPGQSSFYTDGTEHGQLPNSDWTWNVAEFANGIHGKTYRVKAIVFFANGDPNITYYGNAQTF